MDDRIMHNPHLEAMPDHAGPHYQVLQLDALVQNGMPVDQAMQALDNSWTMNHDARILAWDQQVADDAVAAQLQAPQQQVPEDPPNRCQGKTETTVMIRLSITENVRKKCGELRKNIRRDKVTLFSGSDGKRRRMTEDDGR